MSDALARGRRGALSKASLRAYASGRWEELFFLVVFLLLSFQVLAFVTDVRSLAPLHGAISAFAALEFFVAGRLSIVATPLILLPLVYLLACRSRPAWARRWLDILGVYIVMRMAIQLIGLNILVFDSTTSRFTLITQLLFFLPYSLLVWGWVYWRLDEGARAGGRQLFRLDCDGLDPRPIDYLVASFSSVFSASISAIKGRSARARLLILVHGFLVYDVMGLTLSRAVALVQSR